MLNLVNDVLSVWEIAHRWHGEDPNKSTSNDVPLNVQDKLRLLCRTLFKHEMQLCKDRIPQWNYHYKHPGNEEYAERRAQYHIEKTKDLEKCFVNRIYDIDLLDDIFIREEAIAEFCCKNDIPLPEFWFGKEGSEIYENYISYMVDAKGLEATEYSFKLNVDHTGFVTEPNLKRLEVFITAALDAHNEYWKEYDKDNKSDVPDKDKILDYLKKKYSPKLAIDDIERIQIAIRHPATFKNKNQGRGA